MTYSYIVLVLKVIIKIIEKLFREFVIAYLDELDSKLVAKSVAFVQPICYINNNTNNVIRYTSISTN